MALAFAQKVVLIALAAAPAKLLTSHRLLVVAPPTEIAHTTASILWLLAFVYVRNYPFKFLNQQIELLLYFFTK